MNILFFGPSSLAARDLSKEILKNNKVFFFTKNKKNINKKKKIFYLSLNRNYKNLTRVTKIKFDYLFLFSSYVPKNEKKSSWNKCYDINVQGYINLLSNFNFKIKKIIYISSCGMYQHDNNYHDEKSLVFPNNSYSFSKFIQENIVRIYCSTKKIEFLSYRLGYVIGKNMYKQRLVVKLLNQKRNKINKKIYNKNLNLNLIHSKEISKIMLQTYQRAKGIYNLTRKKMTPLNLFVDCLKKKKNRIRIKINNYSSKKIREEFAITKDINFNKIIQIFENEN